MKAIPFLASDRGVSRQGLVGFFFAGLLSFTGLADSWNFRGPNRVGADLYGVAHGPDGFIAVGSGGLIGTSPDGRAWNFQQLEQSDVLIGVAMVDGLSVVVGANGRYPFDGTGVVWVSQDRQNWYRVVTNAPTTLTRVIHADGRFAAIGGSGWSPGGGTTGFSGDGKSWTFRRQEYPAGYLKDIAWTGSGYIYSGASGLATSADALDWTPLPAPMTQPTGMAVRDTTIVAVERWGGMAVSHNSGQTWSALVSPGNTSSIRGGLWDVSTGPEGFVAVGDNGSIQVSPDGDSWTNSPSGTTELLEDVVHGDGRWVVVGRRGVILTSTDARTWEPVSVPGPDFRDLAFGAGRFVAVTPDATWVSTNGTAWEFRPGNGANGIAFGGGRFVSVGTAGRISSDGIQWTATANFNGSPMSRVVFGGGRFFAAGGNNALNEFNTWAVITRSGTSWSSLVVPRVGEPTALSYANSRFALTPGDQGGTALLDAGGVVVGGYGASTLAGGAAGFFSVHWSGAVLVNGVGNGAWLTSVPRSAFQSDGFYAAFGGWWRRADGYRPVTWVSTNLVGWRALEAVRSVVPNGMAVGNGHLVVVGDGFIAERPLTALLEPSTLSIETAGDSLRLRWPILPGHRYQIETAANGRNWQGIDTGTNGSPVSFSEMPPERTFDLPRTNTSGLYRLRIHPD